MTGYSNRAASPIVVGLLLVVLVVAGAIFGYVFLFGAQEGFNTNPTAINAVITPSLYSTNAKVGVYGDTANFTIILTNTLTTLQRGAVEIGDNGQVVQSVSFVLLASQTTTLSLNQLLNATGIWSVKVTTRGLNASNYQFQVFKTKDEADFVVAQWRDQNFYRNLVLGGFVVAWASFIISAASLARRTTTVIR